MLSNATWILLADASETLASEYEAMLQPLRLPIHTASSTETIFKFADQKPDLLILDLGQPQKIDGLKIMEDLKEKNILPATIVMTGNASINIAVRAMQLGARDFLIKPFNAARLIQAVKAELQRPANETMPPDLAGATLQPSSGSRQEQIPILEGAGVPMRSGFIGTSPAMQSIYTQIEHAARSQATVFITGESGTGKEVCARAIHDLSNRAGKPFIPINCAAIPRDLIESELFGHVKGAFTGAVSDRDGAASLADSGTLFLDEIAEMTLSMQTKLLRFLQDLTFIKVGGSRMEKTDIRIVCATNRDPLAEIRNGNFREDLFYRLYVVPIDMPPLRNRGEDIIDIALGLLNRYAAEERKRFSGFSHDAEHALRQYGWPGNIRQLQNVIRHAVVMHESGIVTARMLPATLLHTQHHNSPSNEMDFNTALGNSAPMDMLPQSKGQSPIRPLAEVEREIIEEAIQIYGGNIARAAMALGVSPSTIYRKKAAWDSISDPQFEGQRRSGGVVTPFPLGRTESDMS